MRFAWYSNAPDTPTGYGSQTKQVVSRLLAEGHKVDVLANYGQIAGIRDWNGAAIWAQGHTQYSVDVIDEQVKVIEPDWIMTLYDVWVLKGALKDRADRVISWTPIDHYPVTPEVLRWAREHRTIAMSRFGQRALAEQGVESTYIPHAVERIFTPTESNIRERMQVPEDAFLVTINAANIGTTPPRKWWSGNLQAMAMLMARHDDVYLYIHTDLVRPNGVPIPILVDALGMPKERVRKVDHMPYRCGLIGEDELARIYSASDVLLATSKGEGFGIPVVEAMACGTPAIVADFSAQPELVGDTGWRVPVQLDWDHYQASFFCEPLVHHAAAALEAAYLEHGSEAASGRRLAAIAKAAEYDADTVWEQHWRPFLAGLETPKRKGLSNAAKRRERKARAA